MPFVVDRECASRGPSQCRWIVPDRMAVLVVGLIAGFAVGLSFSPSPAQPVVMPVVSPVAATLSPTAALGRRGSVNSRVQRRVATSGTVRVGVFGDSFGIGIWDGLYRQLRRGKGFEVLRFGREATGFTRYNMLDLAERARQQLAEQPIDVAVISYGANDAIPFYADNRLQPLMSAGWQRIVGERIDQFVAVARSTGATVYWVGLPAMRDPELDANIRAMNALYAAHMRRLAVPFIDTRPLSVDASGHYAAHLPDATGTPQLMRTPDGLHMIGIGYERITHGLADRIRDDARRMRDAAGLPPERTSAGERR
jgi:hypothetical protein